MKILKFKMFESAKFPDIKKVTYDGFNILVGRNSESNDHLTTVLAEDDDIWLHIVDYPSSHVLIKVYDFIPSKEVIRHAAEICKKNSKAKDIDDVKVIYCKAKFVKKCKDCKQGEVLVDEINSNYVYL